MLEMQHIKKVYRTDLIETHALEDFSLAVRPGEFVAVMGPSGSGKTTFLNVAGLLDTFDQLDREGRVDLREEDLDGDGAIDVRSFYRAGRLVRRELSQPEAEATLPE